MRIASCFAIVFAALAFVSPVRADALDDAFGHLPLPAQNTQIRLLTENHDAWYARWHVLSNAKQTIDCTYFTVSPDFIGESMIAILMQKAREGVQIRMLIDSRGAFGLINNPFTNDYLPALARFPNVKIRRYNPFSGMLSSLPKSIQQGIASNHSKLIIVDGQTVIAGGRNLSNHWFTAFVDDPEAFHDIDFIAKGAAIGLQAKKAFEDEYDHLKSLPVKPANDKDFQASSAYLSKVYRQMEGLQTGTVVPGSGNPEMLLFKSMNKYANFQQFAHSDLIPVSLLGKHSAANPIRNPVTDSLLALINASSKELTIAHAYMVLTDRVKGALKAASDRGVKIRFLTNSPESTESMLTQAFFVKEWKEYLRDVPNMRIIAMAKGRKLHGKVIVVDGRVTILGSYNLDPMSETINAEDAAIVKSPAFAAECVKWMDEMLHEGIEYKIKIEADGTLTQVVGPSDHCKRRIMLLLKVISWFGWLRPLV